MNKQPLLVGSHRSLTRIKVSPINRSAIPDSVANRNSSRTLDHRPDERVCNPGDDDLKGRDSSHGHEEHAKEPRSHARRAANDGVAYG
jgi:hypothetical protein